MKTKRLTALLISVLMILQMFAVTVAAEETATSGTCGENVTWTLVDGVLTISGTGPMKDYDWDEVTPWNDLDYTSIIIKNGVTSIGASSFTRSPATMVSIPSTVKTIKYAAFNQSMLESVEIPSGVETIGNGVFGNCYNLKSIFISDTVVSFDANSLVQYPCDITLDPANAAYVMEDSVIYNKDKTELVMCTNRSGEIIDSFVVPDTVKTIKTQAFQNCLVKNVVIPNTVTKIEDEAFCVCDTLESVTISDNVKQLPSMAFALCDNLETITLPLGLTSMQWRAIAQVPSLKSVYFRGHAPTEYISYEGNDGWNTMFDEAPEDMIIYYYEGANGFTTPTWTAPDGIVYNTVMLSHEHHIPTYVDTVLATCKATGINEHWICGCGKLFSDEACTVETTLEALTLPTDSSKHGETEIRDAVAATEDTDGYTGDTWCIDCNTKIADGSIVKPIRGACNENISWVLADGVLTVSGTGDMPIYYDFTNRWDLSSIKSVIIEEGITSIGDSAFENSSLTSVNIPASVTSIKDRAFGSCWYLTEFTVAENNQFFSAEDGVLFNKNKTELIVYPLGKYGNHYDVPESVTSIANSAFKYCFALASITLPENLRNIGNEAFWNCDRLSSVVIPASVTNIGSGAFASCNNLSSISVDENNQYYCSVDNVLFNKNKTVLCAFLNKSSREYTIPESVTSIGNFAFNGCSGLSAITLPDNLVTIGDYAFNMCSGLTSITIPDSVTTIGNSAFNSCSGLTTVTIPGSVTSLGSAFSWCTALQSVVFEGDVPAKWGNRNIFYNTSENFTIYCNEGTSGWSIPKWQGPAPDGTVYNTIMLDENGNPVAAPEVPDIVTSGICGPNIVWRLDVNGCLTISGTGEMYWDPLGSVKSAIKSVVIEDGVTTVGGYAFYGCENLASVTLPDTVTVIKDSAFRACPALTEIVIPDSVETIELYAFENCPALESVTIGDSVTFIAEAAFMDCVSLKEVIIPDSVTEIGRWTFAGCSALESVTLGNKITVISDSAFRVCTSLKKIIIPDSVETIEVCAFEGCTALESVVIGDSVTFIGDAAFLECEALESVTIGNAVAYIDESAFRNCIALTEVIIPDSVTEIGIWAFAGCSALETLEFGSGLTKIDECAFRDNTSLKSVVIPENVTELGLLAFFNCTSLESVVFDDCNPVVRDWAFQNCTALRYVDLGSALTELGIGMFCDCENLEALYFTGNAPTTIGNDAFWNTPSNVKWYYYEGTEGWTTPVWVGPNGHGYTTAMLPAGTDIPVESDTEISDLESIPFVDADTIVVDGEKDTAYHNGAELLVNNRYTDSGNTGALASASMLTNNGLLYLYVDVIDPQVVTPSPEVQANEPWVADSVEFLFRANNNIHQFRVDVTDYLSYYRNQNGIVQAYGTDAEEYFVGHKVIPTNTGYAVEFCIDTKMFGVSSGETIGIQMQLNDTTTDGGWSCYHYRATDHAFTVEDYDEVLIGVDEEYVGQIVMLGSSIGNVPYIKPDRIIIDGQYSSVWDNALTVDIDQFNYGDENASTRGKAYMYWTEGKWYLFVDVKDDEVVDPDADMQANAPWQTDSVEMFFDFGHAHSDLVKQFRIDCAGYPSYYVENDYFHAYGDDAMDYFDEYKVLRDEDGYNIEMVIDLSKWGLEPGDDIGIQLQINDVISADPTNVFSCWNMHQSMGAGSWDADLYDYITLEAKPVEVEKPVEIPVTEDEETVSVKVEDAVVQGSTVTVNTVDEEALASVFNTPAAEPDDGEDTGDTETTPAAPANTVTIDVSNVKSEGSEEAEKVQQVTIPATVVDTIKTAAENNNVEDAKLAVHLTTGSIILDKTTLDVINKAAEAEEGTTTTVSLVIDDAEDNLNETQTAALENTAEDEVVYGKLEISMEVTKTTDSETTTEKIHDFDGGTVQLEVPFEIPEGLNAAGFTVYYLDEDGNLEPMDTQYVNGKITWTTGHFSDYIIMYKEPPKEPIKINVGEIIDGFIDQLKDAGREILPYEPLYDGTFDLQEAIEDVGDWAIDGIKDWTINHIQNEVRDHVKGLDIDFQSLKDHLRFLCDAFAVQW